MRFFRRKKRMTFFGITPENMPHLVHTYVAKLETEESAKWCKCVWRIHPDDQMIRVGHCRVCNQPRKGCMGMLNATHVFTGIRRVRVDNNPFCPVHTKEGLIVGFVEWLSDNA